VEKLLINFQEAGSFLSNPVLHPQIATPNQIWEVRAADESPSLRAGSGQPLATAATAGTDDPMTGRHLGVYELRRRVGQGGMAAVFLAVRADGEYRQQVAIKLVLPGLEKDKILSRFRKERQTLAGLDHPNIVKLLDGGSTAEGLPYLVMDYVEGSPIDKHCDSHKLSVDERLRLFIKVCEAVQHAHQKLVIHRDLKPGNILVTADGVPKLLDFGIAKVLEPDEELQALTQTGGRCMTPVYASPEQVRGRSVTAATDIYSLGVVLYELLTGHRPYRLKEHTASEMERAICEQEPETPSTAVNRVESETSSDGTTVTTTPEVVSQTREGQPERLRRRLRGDLDNIVLKALQKEPERRYSSVEEFSRDIARHLRCLPVKARHSTLTYRISRLVQRHKIEAGAAPVFVLMLAATAWSTFQSFGHRDRTPGSPSMRIRSLAVLPLGNLSGDPAQEYLSDGMTDALITDLAQIGSLKVISRNSIAKYKKTDKPLPKIARELNVDAIVEGTVQRSSDRVRITAQLVYAPSDKHLWANSYERELRDVFALERDVAQEIAKNIQTQLKMPKQPYSVNAKALDAYLRGTYYLNRITEEETRKAQQYFQQAIDSDPNFAPAYVGMALAHEGVFQGSTEDTAMAGRAARRALELDPTLSDAWATLGKIKLDSWDWAGMEQDYRKALELNPNNAKAHEEFGALLDANGRLDEGLRECQVAQELDPNHEHLSTALYDRREFDRSIDIELIMLRNDPDNAVLHHNLYLNYEAKGMYKDAVQHLGQMCALAGFPQLAVNLDKAFAISGYRGAIREYAEQLEHLHATKQVFVPVNLAGFYTTLGDKDRAFYWLEQAYKHGPGQGIALWMMKVYVALDPLHSDPRFKDLVHRIGLPQ
jgi:serine/threonine protein kinase